MEVRRILLDTCAYSTYLRGSMDLRQVLREADEIAFTPVIVGELLAGFKRGAREAENRKILQDFLSTSCVVVHALDSITAECYAAILDHLRRGGTPIPTNDIWIAASAMQHGLAVVTTDRHFQFIPQIIVRPFPAGVA